MPNYLTSKNSYNYEISVNRSRGFTLIEVLVTSVIMSIGLLGIAGLQVNALQSNQGAYYRSQATYIAYDMIDRMRINSDGVTTGQYNSINSASLPTMPTCIANTTGCSSIDLASHDIVEWASSLSRLPTGTATVARVGNNFTVSVNWVEARDVNDPNKSVAIEFQ